MSQHEFNENSLDSKISELLVLQRLDVEDRAEFRTEVRGKLDGLTERADYTNSKIASALLKISEIERIRDENKADLEQIVAAKRVIFKLGSSKLFWVAFAGIIYFGVSTGFFVGLLKWAFSGIGLG